MGEEARHHLLQAVLQHRLPRPMPRHHRTEACIHLAPTSCSRDQEPRARVRCFGLKPGLAHPRAQARARLLHRSAF